MAPHQASNKGTDTCLTASTYYMVSIVTACSTSLCKHEVTKPNEAQVKVYNGDKLTISHIELNNDYIL